MGIVVESVPGELAGEGSRLSAVREAVDSDVRRGVDGFFWGFDVEAGTVCFADKPLKHWIRWILIKWIKLLGIEVSQLCNNNGIRTRRTL